MLKSAHVIFALFFVFWVNSFVFAQSTCAIEGTWSNTTSSSAGNISTTIESTLEFSESSIGDNYTAGDITINSKSTVNGCSCSTDNTGSYNYSISTQTVHASNIVCSNNKTSGDCDNIPCDCTTTSSFLLIVSTFSSDCDSFTAFGVVYEKQSSDWWVWVLIIAVVAIVLVIIAVAAVGGYMYYRKRNQYSSYN